MDREKTVAALKVMEAYAAGAEVEHRVPGQLLSWRPCENPSWSWGAAEYRVRPPRAMFFAVLNDAGIPVQCYATRDLAERHLAGNFDTPGWRVAQMREL